MSNLDHIFLYTILFFVFFVITKFKQAFINKHFWKIVIIPIILYSIILGCRYGWGNDYLFYKKRFEDPFAYKEENVGFQFLNLLLHKFEFNYIGAYITYSVMYIVTGYILIKDYKENKYMLALFLPATLLQSTYTIRQSVAHCFIFLALYFFNHRKWSYSILMTAIAYSIHPVAILVPILILPLFLFLKRSIPWKISIPIYIIVSLSTNKLNTFFTSFFDHYLPQFTLNNKFNNYLQNERWYSVSAIQDNWTQGNLTLILSMFFHISIIYLGAISLNHKLKKNILYFYNIVVIGLVLTRCFWTLEIFRRIFESFVLLYFIPLGYSLYFLNHYRKQLSYLEKRLSMVAIICIITYLLLYYGRFILQSPRYIFFWNK